MKTLLKNAKILKMTDDQIIEGHIVVEGNRIKEIGPDVDLNAQYDKVIDCEGNLLMPGFKDAHTHSGMTFLRSKADDSSLHDWLFNEIFPREANLRSGCIRELTKVAILEYLTSGITGVIDQYFYIDEFEETCVEFGFRLVNLVMFDKDARPLDKCLEYCKTNEKKDYLIKYVISMHSEYTGTDEMFDVTKVLLDKTKLPTTHSPPPLLSPLPLLFRKRFL